MFLLDMNVLSVLSRRSRNQTGNYGHTHPSAVRAILDDPPIFPHKAGARKTNPVGSSHFGIPMIASTVPRSHQILLTTCREYICKRLTDPQAWTRPALVEARR